MFGGDEKANEYLLSKHDRSRVKWLLETLFTNISLFLQFDIIFLLEVPGEDQKNGEKCIINLFSAAIPPSQNSFVFPFRLSFSILSAEKVAQKNDLSPFPKSSSLLSTSYTVPCIAKIWSWCASVCVGWVWRNLWLKFLWNFWRFLRKVFAAKFVQNSWNRILRWPSQINFHLTVISNEFEFSLQSEDFKSSHKKQRQFRN